MRVTPAEAAIIGTSLGAIATFGAAAITRRGFERDQRATALRLKGSGPDGGVTWGDLETGKVVASEGGVANSGVLGSGTESDAEPRERDRQFERVLIEYYSYGLTQARRSFYGSQVISAVGVLVILVGVGIAIWRAETSGDMYASIAASSAGVVSTIIGQLVHRRADIALQHMAGQTESLRTDMAAEQTSVQAIKLLAEVADPEVRTRLQAGLIMKLSGAAMPEIGTPPQTPSSPSVEQAAQE